ncbi:YchJ family protein [Corallincola spongiicola]|uniref:UPF0225 protein EXY25_01640 n=1 Tax=Corallincola spongiicola TaxID=2520508 RepID=A0ABY1WTA7_9GAMM|nr:YchJ family protein [Corallincola spongiicola]TAA47973.1 YchJ family protein [Corallincola spongiicola]
MDNTSESCPCGSSNAYSACCGVYHCGQALAPTCEALMRSRFCAFVKHDGDYLYATHHPDFRGTDTAADFVASARETQWLRLQVLASQGGALDNDGWVRFKAWFMQQGKVYVHEEHSQFTRLEQRWVYTQGDFAPAAVVNMGRNDPCLCGSGKKFKKCCG